LKQCDAVLKLKPNDDYYDNEGPCEDNWHTDHCLRNFDPGSCIEERLRAAHRTEKNIKKLGLMRECALDPAYADRLTQSTLSGMALKDSPILHNE
jgi:hypothetical protein